jgi:hypothetical protein
MTVIGRHFRCLQGKEARRTVKKAVQRGRKKRDDRRVGSRAEDWAATDQVGQAARRRPHRSPTIVEEIRLEEGTNQGSEPAGRWDRERGPCETDDVTRAESRRLGGPAGQREGRER